MSSQPSRPASSMISGWWVADLAIERGAGADAVAVQHLHVMPSNLNERVPREHAKIPNVRNWAVQDYGNRVGIWRIVVEAEELTLRRLSATAR
jgi:hypothetical protein